MAKALITGISGQDGSYLAGQLIDRGYEVHGLVRRCASRSLWRLDVLAAELAYQHKVMTIHDGDITDQACVSRIIADVRPDEIYNLAAHSFVGDSWNVPEYVAQVTGLGIVRICEAVRSANMTHSCRILQASSSEMFGSSPPPQNELTAFHPRSPYGCAKVYAHHAAAVYRESYGMFVSCAVCFNHESPRRGDEFVTQAICRQGVEIKRGQRKAFSLGNMDAVRDWGAAWDYTHAMWLMLQATAPDDYVVATGVGHTVREFVTAVSDALQIPEVIEVDPLKYRPADVNILIGDATKARVKLQWSPATTFEQLVGMMVRAAAIRAAIDTEPK